MDQFSYTLNGKKKNLLPPASLRSLKIVANGKSWRIPLVLKTAVLPAAGTATQIEWRNYMLSQGYEPSLVDEYYARYNSRLLNSVSILDNGARYQIVKTGVFKDNRVLKDESQARTLFDWWMKTKAKFVTASKPWDQGNYSNELMAYVVGFVTARDSGFYTRINALGPAIFINNGDNIGLNKTSPSMTESQKAEYVALWNNMLTTLDAPFRVKGFVTRLRYDAAPLIPGLSFRHDDYDDGDCYLVQFTGNSYTYSMEMILDKKYWAGAARVHSIVDVVSAQAYGVNPEACAILPTLPIGLNLGLLNNTQYVPYVNNLIPTTKFVNLGSYGVPSVGLMERMTARGTLTVTDRDVGGVNYVEYVLNCSKLKFDVDSKLLSSAMSGLANGTDVSSAIKEKSDALAAKEHSGKLLVTYDSTAPLFSSLFDLSKAKVFKDIIESEGISKFKKTILVPKGEDEAITYATAEANVKANPNFNMVVVPEVAAVERSYTVGNEVVSIPEYIVGHTVNISDGMRSGVVVDGTGATVVEVDESNIRWALLNNIPFDVERDKLWDFYFGASSTKDSIEALYTPVTSPEDYRTMDIGNFTSGLFFDWARLSDDAKCRLALLTKGTARRHKYIEACIFEATRLSFA